MHEPDTTWLADEPSDTTRRRRLVVGAATIPWVIVLVVVLVPRQTVTIDPPQPLVESEGAVAPAGGDTSDPSPPTPAALDAPPSVDDLVVTELRGGWRDTPGQGAAAAVAVATAQRWLAERGEDAESVGESDDHPAIHQIVVEAVEQLDDRLAVVTMLSARTTEGRPERIAVGVWIDGTGARPAGEPWRLPEIALDVEPFDAETVDDPATAHAVVDAMEQAGYRDVELHEVERTTSWPLRAHVSAVTPDGRDVNTPVLLRRHLDGYVVAGTVFVPGTGDRDAR